MSEKDLPDDIEEIIDRKVEERMKQEKQSDNLEADESSQQEKNEGISRRGFLKTLGLGAGALTFSSLVSGWSLIQPQNSGTSEIDADTVDGLHASEIGGHAPIYGDGSDGVVSRSTDGNIPASPIFATTYEIQNSVTRTATSPVSIIYATEEIIISGTLDASGVVTGSSGGAGGAGGNGSEGNDAGNPGDPGDEGAAGILHGAGIYGGDGGDGGGKGSEGSGGAGGLSPTRSMTDAEENRFNDFLSPRSMEPWKSIFEYSIIASSSGAGGGGGGGGESVSASGGDGGGGGKGGDTGGLVMLIAPKITINGVLDVSGTDGLDGSNGTDGSNYFNSTEGGGGGGGGGSGGSGGVVIAATRGPLDTTNIDLSKGVGGLGGEGGLGNDGNHGSPGQTGDDGVEGTVKVFN
ncbi:twin-arginine translocation signal domain-containing protein [Candidatus Nanohalococcus occultus]|uniref:Uncharacterized protein n=1 Tax=Candidatus Nanohalococcus occultus TaxID=2978047 RepID=A0ABY8CF00_9ARCH|nr:hypothetical protein SVXNc_0797 [Candidatus Nanohaloarchaeota archaeon SVXNc]